MNALCLEMQSAKQSLELINVKNINKLDKITKYVFKGQDMFRKGLMLLMIAVMCNGVAQEKCYQFVQSNQLFFCDQIVFNQVLTSLVNKEEPDQEELKTYYGRDVSVLISNAKTLCFELNDDNSCYEKVGLMTYNVLYDKENDVQSSLYEKYKTCLKKCDPKIQDKAKNLLNFLMSQ